MLRRRAVEAVAFVVHRHHHQHRQLRSGFARRKQRLVCFVQGGHRLNAQHVYAGGSQGANLLGKRGACFFQSGLPQRFQANSQRTHRAGDPCIARLLLAQMLHGFTRQAHARCIDISHLGAQPVPAQPEPVRSKSVGFQNFCACLQVLFVHRQDEVGVREIQLVVAAIDEDAARVKHGSHGAVGKHRPVGKDVGERWHVLVHATARREAMPADWLLCYTSGVKSGMQPMRDAASDNVQRTGESHPFCSRYGCGTLRANPRGKGF